MKKLKKLLQISAMLVISTGIPTVFSSQASATELKVPTHTLFQAHKLIKAQYPNATAVKVFPFKSKSISGLVGKVLNASTIIEFELDGQRSRVTMLPDGEHLLIGEIVNPNNQAKILPIHKPVKVASTVVNQKPKLTSHFQSTQPKSTVGYQVSERDRITDADIFSGFEGAAKTAAEYMENLEQHEAIVTGSGPKHIYVLVDPDCPNCRAEYLSSLKKESEFTFHWIPVFINGKPKRQHLALSQSSAETNLFNLDQVMRNPRIAGELPVEADLSVGKTAIKHQGFILNISKRSTPVTIYRNKDGIPTKLHGYSSGLHNIISADM